MEPGFKKILIVDVSLEKLPMLSDLLQENGFEVETTSDPFGALDELERKVAERTQELLAANQNLQQELAEMKRAEEISGRAKKELRMISSCNQALMRAADKQAMLRKICNIICEQGGYRTAWVAYAGSDGSPDQPLFWVNSQGEPTADEQAWADVEIEQGPTGRAIRSGENVLAERLAVDQDSPRWLKEACTRGYGSCVAIPLKNETGKTFGALSIYSADSRFGTEDDVRLLEELAGDISFGISFFRARDAAKKGARSIALLNFALNNVREAALLTDEQGRFRYVNEDGCRVLGYSREELLAMQVSDIDPDFPAERWAVHWDELKSNGSLLFEGRHTTKDGRILPIELFANYFEYEGQGFNMCFARDITERKRMEAVLRESEERFRTITEKSLVGVYIIQDNLFRYVNPAFAEMHGHLPGDMIDKLGPLDFLVPEDAQRVMSNIRLRTEGEIDSSHQEFHTISRDGSIRILEAFGSRVMCNGRPAVLGTVIDVTERKISEEKLFQVKEWWERTFDAVPDLIAIIDTDFRIVQANKAMADRLGFKPAECVGMPCYRVVHHSDVPHQLCPHRLTLEDCREHMAQLSEERLGGDFIVTTSPVQDSAGRMIGSVHVARDVTSLLKADAERNKLEAQLYQAQKMEAVGQLAGGIAHDFNNILTAIIGYADMIRRKIGEESPLCHHVEQVLVSAERAAELTHGLLAFSRAQPLHAQPVNVCGIVRAFEKMLGRLIPEDIDFVTSIAEEDLVIMADKGQLQQVLMNLVANAKDAMPMGGKLSVEVSRAVMDQEFIHAHGFGQPGSYVSLSVADTGHGMDEETKNRIFEPFFTTKEVGRGTGLGMSIIYGIVLQHKGYISVESEKGRGSIFRVLLPLIPDTISEDRKSPDMERPMGGTETILLAEDENTVRDLHRIILEEAGYRVLLAVDGQDALETFMEHIYEVDLLLTDVIMPKINGKILFEQVSHIRPEIKVLFMSGYTRDIIVQRGLLEEEYPVLKKPVSPNELLKTIREIIGTK